MKQIAWILLIWMAFVSVIASAQQLGGAQDPPQTISVDVDLVDILFTVTDKKGKSIRNLKRENFKVYEDNSLQTISSFSSEGNLPLTIALLLDTSGSIRDRLRFAQEAANEFFLSTLVRGKDRGMVLSFHSAVDVIQDFTDDPDKLAQSIRRMRAGGATALYDAIYLAAREKLTAQSGRRIIVVITDGDDTSSRLSMTEALEMAQRNDVVIYAISTNSSGLGGEKNRRGDDVLKKFTDETGGKVFFPFKLDDLSSSFSDITKELRFQYGLAYSPTNLVRDGSFRLIRIDADNKDYKIRARNGYYAPRSAPVR